ncbi:MAG TPA: hypothetical protein VLA98_01470, partial [Solirubrobacteraceae bacterium]|nr:hypothetical protein [Solirubrobacteraceae bacterium]
RRPVSRPPRPEPVAEPAPPAAAREPAAAPEPAAVPEPAAAREPQTAREVAEALGLEAGRTPQEPDEIVESEGAGTAGAEIHVDEPWPGYGAMRAPDVVDRLRAADAATKAVVRLYEQQHRRRRTVLAATGP